MGAKQANKVEGLDAFDGAAEDGESAIHVVRPALYLAFTVDEREVPADFAGRFSRVVHGRFNHCELVFNIKRVFERVIVPVPSEHYPKATLFRGRRPFDSDLHWVFLRVPCSPEQIRDLSMAVGDMVARGDYFSLRARWRAGLPWVPEAALRYAFPEPAREGEGRPTFCSDMCLRAMHAAGMLTHVDPAMTSASALWHVARVNLHAFEQPFSLQLVTEDATGYRVNMDHVLGVV